MSSQVLKLTCTIQESNVPGIFIGKINEIEGIFAQADSEEEVYADLWRHTYLMLPRKREQVVALLQKQAEARWEELLSGAVPAFNLAITSSKQLQAA